MVRQEPSSNLKRCRGPGEVVGAYYVFGNLSGV